MTKFRNRTGAQIPLTRLAGVVVLEFAIAATLFFLLLLGALLWGLTMWELNTLQYSSERGARCAILISKECGTATNFAAQNAYGLSAANAGIVTADNFVFKNTPISYSTSTSDYEKSSRIDQYPVACVNTKDVGTIPGRIAFIGMSGTFGSIMYCRGTQ